MHATIDSLQSLEPQALSIAEAIAGAFWAADVVQDALIQAWRHLHRYDPARCPLEGWYLTIVKRRAIDYMRNSRVRGCVSLDGASYLEPQAHSEADAATISEEEWQRVEAALEQLTPKLREAILMRHDGGTCYDHGDAAGCNPGTYRWRVGEALRKLRQIINQGDAP